MGTAGFVPGAQWHPEYRYSEDPASVGIFRAFGEAWRQCRLAARARSEVPRPSRTGNVTATKHSLIVSWWTTPEFQKGEPPERENPKPRKEPPALGPSGPLK
jgi:hypothetical protein